MMIEESSFINHPFIGEFNRVEFFKFKVFLILFNEIDIRFYLENVFKIILYLIINGKSLVDSFNLKRYEESWDIFGE